MDESGARITGTESESIHIGLEIAAAAAVAAQADAVPLMPDANNLVVLPAGATLDDIQVDGRNLVIRLDDGRVFIIPDGAIYVPQIVIEGDGEEQIHEIVWDVGEVGRFCAEFQFEQMPDAAARFAETLVGGVEFSVASVGYELVALGCVVNSVRMNFG